MTSNAIHHTLDVREDGKKDEVDLKNVEMLSSSSNWINRVLKTMDDMDMKKQMKYATSVHPCVIDGKRVLVYEKNLRKRDPDAFLQLQEFAEANGFKIREDQRRNLKRVKFDRRSKMMPMMVLSAGLFLQQATQAEQINPGDSVSAVNVMPAVEVLGKRDSAERPYLQRDGKRFISGPYGEMESILAVSAEAKAKGELRRVSTRGMTLPNDYSSSFVNRYDYQFSDECGGAKYSYYEGEGFGALGYHHGDKVILDVLIGGGPFSSPKLWGPYDQVLNDNIEMHLMMGNGKKDGMGLLKASYAIGMTPILPDEDFNEYGSVYTSNTTTSMQCIDDGVKAAPVLRQAKLDKDRSPF